MSSSENYEKLNDYFKDELQKIRLQQKEELKANNDLK